MTGLGRVRTRKVKVLAREMLELHRDKITVSFEDNKLLVDGILRGSVSKKLRNKVAGYLTALVKQAEAKKTAETAGEVKEGAVVGENI